MSNALKVTGKSILFNICIIYSETTHLWGVKIADMWRTGGDIVKNLNQNPEVTYNNWYGSLNQLIGKESYAGNRHWNDPDNLIIGFPYVGASTSSNWQTFVLAQGCSVG